MQRSIDGVRCICWVDRYRGAGAELFDVVANRFCRRAPPFLSIDAKLPLVSGASL